MTSKELTNFIYFNNLTIFNRLINTDNTDIVQEKSSVKPRSKGGRKDLESLKKELELDVHKIPIEDLFRRLESDPLIGLSAAQARSKLLEYGPNELTPPATTSEWVRFFKQLFGGFQILLWTGAFLCFIAYGIQTTQFDIPHGDNVGENSL